MTRLIRGATAIVCAVAAIAAGAAPTPRSAPNCPLALPSGSASIARLGGHVVYLDFWASWCVSCLASFPFMERMQRDLGARGLQVIAVNLDERPADAARFLASHHVSFPIALGANAPCARQFKVDAMPSTFLIDRSGRIRAVHAGFGAADARSLRAQVETLLAEPART